MFPAAPLQTGREVLPHPAFHQTFFPAPFRSGSSCCFRSVALLGSVSAPGGNLQRSGYRSVVRLPGLPSPEVLLSSGCGGTMPGSDSLSDPCGARGGPLQFRIRLWARSISHTPGGSSEVQFQGLPSFRGLRSRCPSSAPPGPLPLQARVNITARQSSLDATDRAFARPPSEDFVNGLRRPDFAGRRRLATRQLGLYRDRTFTGKPDPAFLDTRSGC